MPELVSCFECGHQISSVAYPCPHCTTMFPRGRMCSVCFQTSKDSAGTETYRDDETGRWICEKCYSEIQQEFQSVQYTCPACKNTERCYTWSQADQRRCRICGHPVEGLYLVTRCSYCRGPLLGITAYQGWDTHKNCTLIVQRQTAEITERMERERVARENSGCLTTIVLLIRATHL